MNVRSLWFRTQPRLEKILERGTTTGGPSVPFKCRGRPTSGCRNLFMSYLSPIPVRGSKTEVDGRVRVDKVESKWNFLCGPREGYHRGHETRTPAQPTTPNSRPSKRRSRSRSPLLSNGTSHMSSTSFQTMDVSPPFTLPFLRVDLVKLRRRVRGLEWRRRTGRGQDGRRSPKVQRLCGTVRGRLRDRMRGSGDVFGGGLRRLRRGRSSLVRL